MWLSEFAVLGLFAAWGAAVTKYSKETSSVANAAGKAIKEAARKAKLV